MANTVTLNVSGVKDLNRALALLAGRVSEETLGRDLYRLGQEIMAESKQLVPVDTGALRSSGQVSLPYMEGDHVVVMLGYGDTSVDYAVAVHEIPPSQVAHIPPTQWKYLEVPVLQATKRLEEALAAGLVTVLREVPKR